MTRSMRLFTAATLAPVVLIAAALTFGGLWAVLALGYLTLLTYGLDKLVQVTTPPGTEAEFPAADRLSATLAIAHFALLFYGVTRLSGDALGTPAKLGAGLALALFLGQVSMANAHELIHRSRRDLFALGKWVYISMLYGHHTSAHPKVHHRHVATPRDPNTARRGESYYHFLPRAYAGSFRAGFHAEAELLTRRDGRARRRAHPYPGYIAGTVALLLLSGLLGGPGAVAWHIGLGAYATAQLIMSDYVQHYGLTRARLPNGKPEPVGAQHSWNNRQWFSSRLMVNAPRHSDHHAHPGKPYPALVIPEGAPVLPYSLPVMGMIATVPPLWRRVMRKRLARLEAQNSSP